MKKKNWILAGLAAFTVVSCFLFIGFSSHASALKEKSTCCCQMNKHCDARSSRTAPGETILENLSRQFLTISP